MARGLYSPADREDWRDATAGRARASSRCSSSAPASRSSACSSRTWRRRGYGRFVAVEGDDGDARRRSAISARTSSRRARAAARSPQRPRASALEDDHRRGARGRRALGARPARLMPVPREDRPGQPVYAITEPPPSRATAGCAPATLDDLERLLPVCAAAHEEELGVDPLAARRRRLPLAHPRADRRGPLVGLARGRRGPSVQGRGLGLDADGGAGAAGLGRPRGARARATAQRGLRDLCRLLLGSTPYVTLFVRTENAPGDRALRLDRDASRVGRYRSLLFYRGAGDPRAARRERLQRARAPERRRLGSGRADRRRGRAGAARSARRCAASRSTSASRASSSACDRDRRRGARRPRRAAARRSPS